MIINYRKLSQQTIIYLLAIIGLTYDHYREQKACSCADAQKLKRAFKTGLKYLSSDNRYYFDCYSVMRASTEEELKASEEADRIFYGTF